MIILLNGPLGVGKSTLAEALTEALADRADLGEPFDVLAPVPQLVTEMLRRLGPGASGE